MTRIIEEQDEESEESNSDEDDENSDTSSSFTSSSARSSIVGMSKQTTDLGGIDRRSAMPAIAEDKEEDSADDEFFQPTVPTLKPVGRTNSNNESSILFHQKQGKRKISVVRVDESIENKAGLGLLLKEPIKSTPSNERSNDDDDKDDGEVVQQPIKRQMPRAWGERRRSSSFC